MTAAESAVYTDHPNDQDRILEMSGVLGDGSVFIKTDVLTADVECDVLGTSSASRSQAIYGASGSPAVYGAPGSSFPSGASDPTAGEQQHLQYGLTHHVPQFGTQDSPLCFPFTFTHQNTPLSPSKIAGPSTAGTQDLAGTDAIGQGIASGSKPIPAPLALQHPTAIPALETAPTTSASEISTPRTVTPTLQVPAMPHVVAPPTGQSDGVSPAPPAGVISTPVPSRPSSPPLSGPILGYSTDLLRLAHVITRKRKRNDPVPSTAFRVSLELPRDWQFTVSTFVPGFIPPSPTLSPEFISNHGNVLSRVTHRGLLIGAVCVYNDAEAATQFVVNHPTTSMAKSISVLVEGMADHVAATSFTNNRPQFISRRC